MKAPYPGIERLRSKTVVMSNGDQFHVYYICEYFPKRFAESALPDSKAIISVKNGEMGGATYFAPKLKAALGAQAASAAFVVMPGHAPAVEGSGVGLRLLVRVLGCGVDLSNCLARVIEVPKSSAAGPGGRPDARKHVETMACTNPQSIKGRDVVLLDDVVTQGETMRAGRYHLLKAGAASVTCLAVGKTTWSS